MTTIKLVEFRSELFPLAESDFKALRDHHVSVFRIPRPLIGTLKVSLLKRARIEVIPFSEVYQSLVEKLQSSLPDARFKTERNIVLIAFDSDDLTRVNEVCTKFQHYLGRYGIKVLRESKSKSETSFITRLEMTADPGINPSFYFGDLVEETSEIARLHLSNFAALVFTSRPSKMHPGRKTFGIEFQDKMGEEWVTAFSRAFDLGSLEKKEVTDLVNLVISLVGHSDHYEPPVTPKTSTR